MTDILIKSGNLDTETDTKRKHYYVGPTGTVSLDNEGRGLRYGAGS